MTVLFEKVLNMSITAAIVIGAVLCIRLFLRKAPKIFSYVLWAVVLFRLLCPVSLPSPVALLGLTGPEVTEVENLTSVNYLPADMTAGIAYVPVSPGVPAAPEAVSPAITVWDIGTVLWVLGMAVMALYSGVVYLRLRRELVGTILLGDRVYLADHIGSAFVLGAVRPKIFLPSRVGPRERVYILAHEKHHIRRGDHVWKLLAWIALCVHWFNPLVWAAFLLAGKDMEMSCDEAVIRELGTHVRADYAQSLLRLATHQRILAFTPLAFGEGDTKGRVKNMANWKKPGIWLRVLCLMVCAAVLAACGLNPGKETALLRMEEISLVLPEAYTHAPSPRGGLRFLADGKEVGGLECYVLPEDVPLEHQDANELGEAIGLEETGMEMMAYMGGSSVYGDMEINYFYEPDPASWNRTHTFFLGEGRVYDIWFDENQVSRDRQSQVLMTAALAEPQARTEASVPSPAEDGVEALARCKAVLDTVRSSESFSIKAERTNEGGNVLNDSSTIYYYQDGEDWLQYHEIPVQGIVDGVPVWFDKFAFMCVDGAWFDNMAFGGLDDKMQVTWGPSAPQEVWVPWLASYNWEESEITYISTLPEGSGSAVTLQINAPYKGRADSYPGYYVVFHFDETGAFRHVDVEASFRCEGTSDLHTVEREGIMSLEQGFAADEISRQYARATGE